jgi:hypothetical protein
MDHRVWLCTVVAAMQHGLISPYAERALHKTYCVPCRDATLHVFTVLSIWLMMHR